VSSLRVSRNFGIPARRGSVRGRSGRAAATARF
jgi:hypothetical protein